MTDKLTWIALLSGGIGPNVWDDQVEVEAWDFPEALKTLAAKRGWGLESSAARATIT